jgi:hypothetical protein
VAAVPSGLSLTPLRIIINKKSSSSTVLKFSTIRCFYILISNSTEIKVFLNFETITSIDVIYIIVLWPRRAHVLVKVSKKEKGGGTSQ